MLREVLFLALLLLLGVFSLAVSAGEIDPSRFQEVEQDDRVWAVEFYSPMCGSCAEFAPTWETVETKLKSIHSGKLSIDTKEGMAIAKKLGVLEEGLPNIRLFDKKHGSTSIMAGDPKSAKDIMSALRSHVKGLNRRDDGFFLKQL